MAETTPDVWIDVSAALTQRAGIARYVRGLTEALVAMDPADRGFTLGTYSHSWRDAGARPFGVPHAGTALTARQWRLQLLAGHLIRRPIIPGLPAGSRFLATDLAYPYGAANTCIVTVHDLTAITHPRTHTFLTRAFTHIMAAQLRRRPYPVVAVSQRTARDVQHIARITPSRISVIYPGAAAVFLTRPTAKRIDEVIARHDLHSPFVLSVGTLEPRKNLRRLVSAFLSVARPHESLVIVGGRGWGGEANFADDHFDTRQVRVLGFVADEDLACLYRACQAFIMPSLYEGFGSPVLEALACGADVICSSECGVLEVVADVVTIVEPLNDKAIARALRTRLDAHRWQATPTIYATYITAAEAHSTLVRQAWPDLLE